MEKRDDTGILGIRFGSDAAYLVERRDAGELIEDQTVVQRTRNEGRVSFLGLGANSLANGVRRRTWSQSSGYSTTWVGMAPVLT